MVNPNLFAEDAAAAYIGMSVAFLRAGRVRGVLGGRTPSPPYLKLGRAVRYSREDLDRWLSERRVSPGKRKAYAARPATVP